MWQERRRTRENFYAKKKPTSKSYEIGVSVCVLLHPIEKSEHDNEYHGCLFVFDVGVYCARYSHIHWHGHILYM